MIETVTVAQTVLDSVFGPGKFVATEAANPFYNNSDREPLPGDIVEIAGYGGSRLYYLYTEVTRHLGHNKAYASNWVSARHGSPDTGPVWAKVSERTLVSSLPV